MDSVHIGSEIISVPNFLQYSYKTFKCSSVVLKLSSFPEFLDNDIIIITIRLSLNLWTMMIIRISCIESLDHNDRRENLLFYNESHSSQCEKPLSSQTSSDDDEDDSARLLSSFSKKKPSNTFKSPKIPT